MKIHIQYQSINEVVQARDSAALLSHLKGEAAKRAPLLLRGVVRAMSDNKFAQEVVSRANAAHKRQDALPDSPDAFLKWAVERGFVTVLEE